MAGYSYQHFEDAFVYKFLTEKFGTQYHPGDPEYDKTLELIQNITIPTHDHILSWFTGNPNYIFPDEKVRMFAADPTSSYLGDKIDNDTIKYVPGINKLYVANIPTATSIVVGGSRVGANPASILYMNGNEIMARVTTSASLSSSDIEVPSSYAVKRYVDSAIQGLSGGGSGDMLKSTYDSNNSGSVDDSERLGNQLPAYYLNWTNFSNKPTTISGYGITDAYTKTEVNALTWNYTTALTNIPSTFTPTAHPLVGSYHTATGLTVGHVLKATTTSAFAFGQMAYADISGTPTIPTQYWQRTTTNLSPATSGDGLLIDHIGEQTSTHGISIANNVDVSGRLVMSGSNQLHFRSAGTLSIYGLDDTQLRILVGGSLAHSIGNDGTLYNQFHAWIRPMSDNSIPIGSGSLRFSSFYVVNNYTNTTYADHLAERTTNHGINLDQHTYVPASTTAYASLNMAHGNAPTSPVDGDIWTTTTGMYVRINGATVGPLGGGGTTDTFKTYVFPADSGYTWGTSNVVAAGTDTFDFVAGSGIAIDSDSTNKALRIRVTGSGGLANAYATMTDGTTNATATASDTFKYRSANNRLTVAVTNNDATHGDNVLLTVNEGNIDHDALANFTQNEHFVQTAITNVSSALATGFLRVTTGTGALTVDTNTYSLSSHTHTINDIGNPTANKSFTMVANQLKFVWTNPTTGDGAMELEATGNFSGDVLHIHQHTGNPNAGAHLVHLESSYSSVVPLYLRGESGRSIEIMNPAGTFTYTIYAGALATANRTLTIPAITANDTFAVLGLAQVFTTANTFRAANAIRVEAASTQDAIVLAGRAGGTSSYAITMIPTTLSSNQTVTLPNRTLTLDYITTSTDTSNGYVKGVASKVTFVTTIPTTDLPTTIVYNSGTPVDNQLAIWTAANTLEGSALLTYDGTFLQVYGSSGNAINIRRDTNTVDFGVGTYMQMKNSVSAWTTYGAVLAVNKVNTSGSEDGALYFYVANAGTLTSTANLTKSSLYVPSLNLPTSTGQLVFGDGDTYLYENADDQLYFWIGGGVRYAMYTTMFAMQGGASTGYWGLLNESGTTTNPNIVPSKADLTTGIGSGTAAQFSLIASSTEIQRVTATGILVNNIGELTASNNVIFGNRASWGTWSWHDSTSSYVGQFTYQTTTVFRHLNTQLSESGSDILLTFSRNTFIKSGSAYALRLGSNGTDNLLVFAADGTNITSAVTVISNITGASGSASCFSGTNSGQGHAISAVSAGSADALYAGSISTGAGGQIFISGSTTTTAYVLQLQRSITGSANASGDILSILDEGTTSGTKSGSLIKATVDSTIRYDMNPRVANSGTNVAYIFDTVAALSGTTLLVSVRNQGSEKFSIADDGSINIPTGATYNINGTPLSSGVTPTDGIFDWVTDKYQPYSDANKAAGRFYTFSATSPSNTTELAWDGRFRATELYGNNIYGGTAIYTNTISNYTGPLSIACASGSQVNLSLQAGNANGAAGTDAGNLSLQAGNAINADTGSDGGNIYLIPGNRYNTGGNGFVYLGNTSSSLGRYDIAPLGTESNIHVAITSKGNAGLSLTSPGTGFLDLIAANTLRLCQTIYVNNTGTNIHFTGGTTNNLISVSGGNLRHLTVQAGPASGTGNDAGNLVLKGGEAIAADTGSDAGHVYIVPGNGYQSNYFGYIYLGDAGYAAGTVQMYTTGSSTNVGFQLNAKGSGAIYITTTGNMGLYGATVNILSSNGVSFGSGSMAFNSSNGTISGANGSSGVGYNLTLTGGAGYTGNYDGGNLYLFGGAPTGTGVRGNVYFGNSSTGYLPAKSSETNCVFYDTTTGKLSYGVPAGGTYSYTNATAMPNTIGGLEAGTTFSARTLDQMWTDLLYPYQYPAFTAFAVTGYQSVLECGVNFTGGAQTFTWTISNASNVNTNSVAIRDITNSTDLLTSQPNDGTQGYTLTAGTQTTNGATRQWGIRATNSKSQQIGYAYITTTFYSPIFYGVGSSGLSVTALQQLAGKRITGEVSFSAQFTTSGNKMYICYPAAWGNLASIKDVNQFDITADWTMTTPSFTYQAGYYYGATMNYNVYEYNNNTTLTNFLVYFNF